jgi:hypothetical protein
MHKAMAKQKKGAALGKTVMATLPHYAQIAARSKSN